MKKWLIIIGLLFLLLVCGFLVFTKVIMPEAAKAFIPVKWQNIPLGQHRTIVHHYMGNPAVVINGIDIWEHKLNREKKYILTIGYGADTTAHQYRVNYQVNILGIQDITRISSDSLR